MEQNLGGFDMREERIGEEAIMDSPGKACSTPTTNDNDLPKGQANGNYCPTCSTPVVQERIGGSIRRFCSDGCRYAWHGQEKRRKLREAIEAIECADRREAILELLGLQRMKIKDGGGSEDLEV